MAKVKRDMIAFKCEKCAEKNYTAFKTKNITGKMETKKYCSKCRAHTVHKETKIK